VFPNCAPCQPNEPAPTFLGDALYEIDAEGAKAPRKIMEKMGGRPTRRPAWALAPSGTIYFSSDIENAIYKVTKK
jgi:hypothetical protein